MDMNAKQLYINILIILSSISVANASDTLASDSSIISKHKCQIYRQRVERMHKGWNDIIPNIATLQYAGGIGMFSLGIGWDYGSKQQWETHLLLGYLPDDGKRNGYASMTLKEIYTPFNVHLTSSITYNPLYVTLMLNTTLNGDFWVKEPDRYPAGYYGFSSKVRFHIGVGQKFKLRNMEHRTHWFKDLTFYYEISSCDLYIRQKIVSPKIPTKDILSIGIGLQYTLF